MSPGLSPLKSLKPGTLQILNGSDLNLADSPLRIEDYNQVKHIKKSIIKGTYKIESSLESSKQNDFTLPPIKGGLSN